MQQHHMNARGDETQSTFRLGLAVLFTALAGGGCAPEDRETAPPDGSFAHTLSWEQAPGTEIVQCHFFKLKNPAAIDVERIQFQFAEGSHHVHIYRSDQPHEDGITDCSAGVSWPRWKLLAGAQTRALDWRLPAGLTMPVGAEQQLMVQVHWLNTSPSAVQARVDLLFHPAPRAGTPVGVMFGVNKRIALEPGERRTLRQWCAMPAGSQLLALMGHFHALGRRYGVEVRPADEDLGVGGGAGGGAGVGQSIYQGADEGTLEFKSFEPAREIPAGQGLGFECEFFNHRTVAASWGPDTQRDEHCNMVAYYYPAAEPSSFCEEDFQRTGPLSGVMITTPDALAGAPVGFEVTMSSPNLADTLIELAPSDPTALELPTRVVIAAGQTSALFNGRALRPARQLGVAATLGDVRREATFAVGGLVLSEVFAGSRAGSASNASHQWIEISNLGRLPVDLAGYSVGAGGGGYDVTRIPLQGVLPPAGCLLVGNPPALSGGTTAISPEKQEQVIAPPLGPGGDLADGVGLFDVAAAAIGPGTVPLDALVYGASNTRRLLDPSGKVAVPVPTAAVGGSLTRRTMAAGWSAELVPTPGICEVR
jgi:hypothetical protein